MHDGFLDKARRKFRKGEFAEVIRLLEGTIFNYRDNHAFFYLLGMSCLRTGDVAGAQDLAIDIKARAILAQVS